jgi:hypothetical protein
VKDTKRRTKESCRGRCFSIASRTRKLVRVRKGAAHICLKGQGEGEEKGESESKSQGEGEGEGRKSAQAEVVAAGESCAWRVKDPEAARRTGFSLE